MALYNTTGAPKVLIGNWNEEWRRLEEEKQGSLGNTGTFKQQDQEPLKTQTQTQMEAAVHRSAREFRTRCPRHHKRLKELEKKVREEVEQENKELHEYLTAKPDFDTINRHDFVKYSDEEYTCPKGRRIMKTLDGEDIPPEKRDTEFLSSFGLTKPPVRVGKTAEEKADYLKTVRSTCLNQTVPHDDPLKGPPVTIYSQRLAEGVFPGTEARGQNPFARSCTFTNEIVESDRRHAYAQDKPEIGRITEMKSSIARAPGCNTSLEPLLDALRERLVAQYGDNAIDWLEQLLRRMSKSQDDLVSIGTFRNALHRMDVQFPERHLQAVFTYFELEQGGKASIDDIMEVLRKPEMTLSGTFSSLKMSSGAGGQREASKSEEHRGENTIRVRIRYINGEEEVVDIEDTVGISPEDKPAMLAKLRSDGYKNIHSVYLEDDPILEENIRNE